MLATHREDPCLLVYKWVQSYKVQCRELEINTQARCHYHVATVTLGLSAVVCSADDHEVILYIVTFLSLLAFHSVQLSVTNKLAYIKTKG